jgi:uncharacterized protein YciI
MATLVYCRDAQGAEALRKNHLAEHLAYIETILDEIAVAGPLRTEPGKDMRHMVGSCLIFHTDDQDAARDLFFNDPYYKAGIFESAEFTHLAGAAGSWVGGKTW